MGRIKRKFKHDLSLLSKQGVVVQGYPYQINQPSGTNSYKPVITTSQGYSGTSGYALVYTQTTGTGGMSIMMNIFPDATKMENIEVMVIEDTGCADCLVNASIAQMMGAGYVVVWEKRGNTDGTQGLYFSIFSEKGDVLRDSVQFTYREQGNSRPRVQGLNRGFVVCWNDESTNPFSNMCEVFNSDGEQQDPPFMVMTTD